MVAAEQLSALGPVNTALTSVTGAVKVRRRHRIHTRIRGRQKLLGGDLGPTGVAVLVLVWCANGKLPKVPAVIGTDVPGKYPEDVRGVNRVRRDEVPVAGAIEPHRPGPATIKAHNHGARRKFDNLVRSRDVLLQTKLVPGPISTEVGVTTPLPVCATWSETGEEDLPSNAGIAAMEEVLDHAELRVGPILGEDVGSRDPRVKTRIRHVTALSPRV